jgi:hypothetical protein
LLKEKSPILFGTISGQNGKTAGTNFETVQQEQEFHLNNLDTALKIIAKIGVLYNSLERCDQKSCCIKLLNELS